MTSLPEKILLKADKFVSPNRKQWLLSMQAEIGAIPTAKERSRFAWGCCQALALDAAKSRRGLNYIARLAASLVMLMGGLTGIVMSQKLGASPEMMAFSKILIFLCSVYIGASILFILSLKMLRAYAVTGLSLAILSLTYCLILSPNAEPLPLEFLMALSLEFGAVMFGLVFISIYLSWLYDPELSEAL